MSKSLGFQTAVSHGRTNAAAHKTPQQPIVSGSHGLTVLYVLLLSADMSRLEHNFQTCTLDILMHLPHSVFSQKQLDLFLWLLKVNNVDDVPSIKQMQKINLALQKVCGIETISYNGALGHKYFVNNLAQIIAQVGPMCWCATVLYHYFSYTGNGKSSSPTTSIFLPGR
jgi:hypothetical protein